MAFIDLNFGNFFLELKVGFCLKKSVFQPLDSYFVQSDEGFTHQSLMMYFTFCREKLQPSEEKNIECLKMNLKYLIFLSKIKDGFNSVNLRTIQYHKGVSHE